MIDHYSIIKTEPRVSIMVIFIGCLQLQVFYLNLIVSLMSAKVDNLISPGNFFLTFSWTIYFAFLSDVS